MSKCLNCDREMVRSGVVPAMRSKYCSNKCRQQFYRNAKCNVTRVTDESVTAATVTREMDKLVEDIALCDSAFNTAAKIQVCDMSRTKLYNVISHYLADTWKGSPEFGELMRRLHSKSVDDLKEEGYFVPAWKYGEVA